MKKLTRTCASLSLGLLVAVLFAGCQATFSIGTVRYYSDRIWYGDPYCRYGGYGCGYYGGDAVRVRVIYGQRHGYGYGYGPRYGYGYGGGYWGLSSEAESATAAKGKRTSWQQEFRLHGNAVAYLRSAFDRALQGDTSQLQQLGVAPVDLQRLAYLQMPSGGSIANAARALQVRQGDLRDFLELYLIRLRNALQTNQ